MAGYERPEDELEAFLRGVFEKITGRNGQGGGGTGGSGRNGNSGGFGLQKLWGFLGIFILLIGGWSSYYTVGPDEEAVIVRLGRYSGTADPGLHFKIPFGIDQVAIVKTTKVHQEEFGFRSRSVNRDGRTQYESGGYEKESLMLTGDLNVAEVEWVVQYKISDPYKYLFKAKDPVRNVRDVSESIMRRVVGDRAVNSVLTTGRMEIADEAKELSQKVLDQYDIGISVVAVKLQDVNPPDRVKPSFNEVNNAKQEQEKMINNAEERYNQVIPEARGKAQEQISQAEGFAEALLNRAKGDAARFEDVFRAYKQAPSVTRKRMYLETMEELFSGLEDLVIVDKDVKGVLPLFQQATKKEI